MNDNPNLDDLPPSQTVAESTSLGSASNVPTLIIQAVCIRLLWLGELGFLGCWGTFEVFGFRAFENNGTLIMRVGFWGVR